MSIFDDLTRARAVIAGAIGLSRNAPVIQLTGDEAEAVLHLVDLALDPGEVPYKKDTQ